MRHKATFKCTFDIGIPGGQITYDFASAAGAQQAKFACNLVSPPQPSGKAVGRALDQSMERRLAAILAADVAGYSRMMEVDEAGTLARLKAHLGEIVEPKITAHHGNIVKTTGDGLLAEFASVVAAVECAVEIQRSMAERNAGEAEDQQTRFRIGINIGDIIIEGGDIFGDGVNIAARLEGLADPGGICVHRDVRSQVRNRLPLPFEDMGEVEVKNIARPLRVYKIVLDGTVPTAAPAKRVAKAGGQASSQAARRRAGADPDRRWHWRFWSNWNPLRETAERQSDRIRADGQTIDRGASLRQHVERVRAAIFRRRADGGSDHAAFEPLGTLRDRPQLGARLRRQDG